jgi:2-hydroxychromene-2-carboxylate isomerase
VAGRATFFFDFNSPYAYLAAERIDELIPDAEWTPIAFPVILMQHGRLEEAMQRDRAPVVAEIRERAEARGLPPVTYPSGWPNETWSFGPLRAALFAGEGGNLREFTRAAFRKFFVDGHSLTELDNLLEAAREAGLDPDEVAEAIERQEIKDQLKEQTADALARGVTGIPTVAIGDELFWGDDRLEEAAAAARRAA